MNRIGNIAFFTGFLLNIALTLYVKGGSVVMQFNSDWLHLLNELPETVATLTVAVLLPYVMIRSQNRNKLISAGSTMLCTTVISGTIILFTHTELAHILSLYIGWVILWFTAFYFSMLANIDRQAQSRSDQS